MKKKQQTGSTCFMLTLRIRFRDGTEAAWQDWSDGEHPLTAGRSPSELAEWETADDLIDHIQRFILFCPIPNDYARYWPNPAIEEDEEILEMIRHHGATDMIRTITMEGYEDDLAFPPDGLHAKAQIITYDCDTGKETAVEYGAVGPVPCERHGGSLAFRPCCEHLEAPEGYFEEKRKQLRERMRQ